MDCVAHARLRAPPNYGIMTMGFQMTHSMQVAIDDAGPIAMVKLSGKLDIVGAEVIAMPLATLSGVKSGLIVDLSGVTSITSMAIRQLVSAVRVLGRRGGRLVLLNPNDLVTEVLVRAGVRDLMPITRSESEARAAAAPSGKAP
jgi:anti-anti-sigma factor